MADTADLLRDVLTRLDALEQENQALRAEMSDLRASVHSPVTSRAEPVDSPSHDRLSRRVVLRKGMQVAAASIAAGSLLIHEARPAEATDFFEQVYVENYEDYAIWARSHEVNSPALRAMHGGRGVAIHASTWSDALPTIQCLNTGSAAAVRGTSDFGIGVEGNGPANDGVRGVGLIGVRGISSASDHGAVYGQFQGTEGYGVVGDGTGLDRSGVLGRNATGEGVRGEGKIGLRGKATGTAGYGGSFEGGKAQLRIVPKAGPAGKPTTGAHSKGELVLDSAATLWICTIGGTPGTWRKVSTTAT